jgi:hypothetical protein
VHVSNIYNLEMLALHKCYSWSEFMQAVAVLTLSNVQVSWNSVRRKIFGYNEGETAKSVLFGLGMLIVKHFVWFKSHIL